jgi:hypothetical protein
MGKRGKETEYEDEFEYEYDWGTIRSGGGVEGESGMYFFESRNCLCV